MHYKNGRLAKDGDKVVNLPTGLSGVLHSTNAQSTSCNGRLAPISQNDAYVTISECLHLDDIIPFEASTEENLAFIQYLRSSDEALLFPNTPLEGWKRTFIMGRRNLPIA